jgi:hypothetical protein
MASGVFTKGDRMDNFQSKVVGYAVVAIFFSFIIHAFLPYIICGLIGWMILRAYENNRHK